MENISEAVYIAGAALLFIVAFTITLMLFGQAKNTTDAVLSAADKSSYYQQIQPNKTGVTRKVGIETIIPTIYRYFQEGFTVRICDSEGKELQVFDSAIEGIIRSNSGTSDTVLQGKLEKVEYANYKKYNDPSSFAYMYGAPWNDDESDKLTRINAYIYGQNVKIGTADISYASNNLIQLKDEEFDESYLEYNISGRYKADGFGNWYSIVDGGKKIIVTYTATNYIK